eukprot:CAMPEP_0182581736 /NCGR_PEP_ID=MMETSP1324-20130603/50784_1 /TAXON_ID=236786 /ORGANISM="Florenciella sp., Strain RCC1587" /LENGTH=46 /DNA_ID= /DNA_START= /DNA_END= /DNA_ORIENTATION=
MARAIEFEEKRIRVFKDGLDPKMMLTMILESQPKDELGMHYCSTAT